MVFVLPSLTSWSSSGHMYLPLTRRCPAIGFPQLRHWGLFLAEGDVSIVVVVVCCVDNSESI